ncbi:hypothetical protein ACOME3_003866 [Neoechinorhynchus agilis]
MERLLKEKLPSIRATIEPRQQITSKLFPNGPPQKLDIKLSRDDEAFVKREVDMFTFEMVTTFPFTPGIKEILKDDCGIYLDEGDMELIEDEPKNFGSSDQCYSVGQSSTSSTELLSLLNTLPLDSVVRITDLVATIDYRPRRIYEAMNILEGLNIVEKIRRNEFRLKGKDGLGFTMGKLQVMSHVLGFTQFAQNYYEQYYHQLDDPQVKRKKGRKSAESDPIDNTLGIICQKLLMLCVTQVNGKIPIRFAARLLAHADHSAGVEHFKRRIHETMGTLGPLGILKKITAHRDGRWERMLVYTGPEPEPVSTEKIFDIIICGKEASKQSIDRLVQSAYRATGKIPIYEVNQGCLVPSNIPLNDRITLMTNGTSTNRSKCDKSLNFTINKECCFSGSSKKQQHSTVKHVKCHIKKGLMEAMGDASRL